MGSQCGEVNAGGRQEWLVDDHCGVEQFQRLSGGQRQHPFTTQPGQVCGVQAAGHGAGLIPQTPAQGDGRQPMGPPVGGQRIHTWCLAHFASAVLLGLALSSIAGTR